MRHPVQRARLPGRAHRIRRALRIRQGAGHPAADRRIRGDGLRTLRGQHVLPADGLVAKTFGFGADAAGVAALDVSGILYNLSAATLGNILGGPVRGAGLLVPQRQTARKGRWRHRLVDVIHPSPSLVILVLQGGAI